MAWPKGVPRKPKEAEVEVEDGAAVPMPDAGPLIYKDRAGDKLGGGPLEGTSYAGEIAKQARLSVELAALAEQATEAE